MKKAVAVLSGILLGLTLLYPTGVIVAACFGYVFKLFSVSGFALALAALSLSLVVSELVCKPVIDTKWVQIVIAVTPLFSLIHAVFCIYTYPRIQTVVGAVICVGCCCVSATRLGRPFWLKSAALALTLMFAMPVISIGWVWFAAGFGTTANEVLIREVPSPNGTYCAHMIERDQGALGGNTVVDVHDKTRKIDLLLFTVEKEPVRVHYGKLGKPMQIYWKSESCLVVDSYEHPIE